MKKLKMAVIGVGYLGRLHALKLASHPEVELAYLVDVNREQAEKVAFEIKKEFSVFPEVKEHFKEVIKGVDAVSIATTTVSHYEVAKCFLEEGIPIFLEKPIAHRLEFVERLIELSEKKGVPFQVGFIERFQDPVKLLFEKVKEPVFIEAHRLSSFVERNLDIDVVLDLMIHDLDLTLLLKKRQKVNFIHAIGAPVFSAHPDIVNARVVFEDGTTCNFTASRVSLEKQRRFRVFQRGAYFAVDTVELSFLEVKVDVENRKHLLEKKCFEAGDPLKKELFSFVESVTEAKPVKVPASECLEVHRLAFQIKKLVEETLRKFS